MTRGPKEITRRGARLIRGVEDEMDLAVSYDKAREHMKPSSFNQ